MDLVYQKYDKMDKFFLLLGFGMIYFLLGWDMYLVSLFPGMLGFIFEPVLLVGIGMMSHILYLDRDRFL